MGNLSRGFEGSRRIDRQDFGLKWNTAWIPAVCWCQDKITWSSRSPRFKTEDSATTANG